MPKKLLRLLVAKAMIMVAVVAGTEAVMVVDAIEVEIVAATVTRDAPPSVVAVMAAVEDTKTSKV
jgi:hypothetical protein